MYLKELTNEEFNKFTNNFIQESIYQTTEYGLIMNKQGFDSLFLGLIDDTGQIIGASLILIEKKYGFKYGYAPKGFLIDYTNFVLFDTFTKLIKKYLGKKDVIAVKICPMIIKNIYNKNNVLIGTNKNFSTLFDSFKKLGYYHLGYNNYFEALKPRFQNVIDISKNDYEIFNNFKRGTKNKIRNSIKKGVKIVRGEKKDLQDLYLHIKNNYHRELNYFDDTFDYFNKNNKAEYYYAKVNTETFLKVTKKNYEKQEKYILNLNSIILNTSSKKKDVYISKKIQADNLMEKYKKDLIEATNMLRDNPEGIVIAEVLIIKNRNTIYVYSDGYDKKYKSFNGKHLLLWTLIQKYSKEGFKYFNLGGVTNITLDNNKYKGLNEFKTSFGGITEEYIGDFEIITNNALYFMYKNAAPIRNIIFKNKK